MVTIRYIAMTIAIIGACVSVWLMLVTQWYSKQTQLWLTDHDRAQTREDNQPRHVHAFERLFRRWL